MNRNECDKKSSDKKRRQMSSRNQSLPLPVEQDHIVKHCMLPIPSIQWSNVSHSIDLSLCRWTASILSQPTALGKA